MAGEKTEKGKLIIVVLLALIFVSVAYVRFFRGKSGSAPDAADVTVALQVPEIDLDSYRPDPERPASEYTDTIERDIFFPVRPEPEAEPVDVVEPEPEPEPVRVEVPVMLRGILMGRGVPVAQLNDETLVVGDRIEGLTVERIEKNRVILRRGESEYVLEPGEGLLTYRLVVPE